MNSSRTFNVAQGALIAALYVILTEVSAIFGLSSGAVQLRISEALCILPLWYPASVMGLFIGCILSNILTGAILWDVVFGSLATLIGAWGAAKLKNHKFFAPLPTILANTVVVPLVLSYAYKTEEALPFLFLTVFLGEFVSAGVFGTILRAVIEKRKIKKSPSATNCKVR